MSFVDIVKKYQNKLSNKEILVKYSLFFEESAKSQCKFVVDDWEKLEALNKIVLYPIRDVFKISCLDCRQRSPMEI